MASIEPYIPELNRLERNADMIRRNADMIRAVRLFQHLQAATNRCRIVSVTTKEGLQSYRTDLRTKGKYNGNTYRERSAAEEGAIEVGRRPGLGDLYGQDILSGRGPYSCRLSEAE